MQYAYTTFWLRVLLMGSLFFSFHAWACGGATCTMNMDSGSSSAANLPSASSSQQTPSSYTFSDSGSGVATPNYGGAGKLAEAVKYDPARGAADFGKLAQTNAQFRKVMHGEQGLSPAARLERQSISRGALTGVASDEVVRPAAYQNDRAKRGFSGARTISTGGE